MNFIIVMCPSIIIKYTSLIVEIDMENYSFPKNTIHGKFLAWKKLANRIPLANIFPTNYFLLLSVVAIHIAHLPIFYPPIGSDQPIRQYFPLQNFPMYGIAKISNHARTIHKSIGMRIINIMNLLKLLNHAPELRLSTFKNRRFLEFYFTHSLTCCLTTTIDLLPKSLGLWH